MFATLALVGISGVAKAQQPSTNVPMLTLNNEQQMPQFGLGTYNTPSHEVAKEAVAFALKSGYRHIDTAHAYGNERAVGEAVAESGVPREEIWITTKLWPSDYSDGNTLASIDRMLERLQTDYIDLLYIHQPAGNYVEAWKAMEQAVASGKVRTLGLSNFDASDEVFDEIIAIATIKPAIMQIECHPYAQRRDIQQKLRAHGIAQENWYPLGSGNAALLSDPTIRSIGEKYGKTNAQVILRWHIQEGFSVIPGAVNPDYITENIDVFNFALTAEDMTAMRSLDREQRFYNSTLEQVQRMATGYIIQD